MTMTCQKCQSAGATIHVTERGRSGAFEAAHYCESCGRHLLPPTPSILQTWPSAELLAKALVAAAAVGGRPLTEQEALGSARAYFSAHQGPGPGGGVSPG